MSDLFLDHGACRIEDHLGLLKEAPSRLTEAGLSDPKGRFFRLSPRGLERSLLRHLNAGIARRLQLEGQDRSFWWEVGSLAVRYQPRSNFPGPMLLIASEEESPRYGHSEEEWRAAALSHWRSCACRTRTSGSSRIRTWPTWRRS